MSVALHSRDYARLRITPVTRNLPDADSASLQHSARVAAYIKDVIRTEGGWIPFSKYMDVAMFAPGLGYYRAGAAKIGAAGDFTTAPEMSALFGATYFLEELSRADVPRHSLIREGEEATRHYQCRFVL